MAATPQRGQVRFRGVQSGQPYTYNIYNSDVAAAFVTWNLNGQAGTTNDTYIIAPEDLVLEEMSLVTGIVDTTGLLWYANGAAKAGYIVQWALAISTLQSRSFPKFMVSKGTRLQLQEIA